MFNLAMSATVKRTAFVFLILLSCISFCFADMTIYFKDGKDVKVSKIVFRGDQADLYLTTGTIMSVAVSGIDLDLSGIGKPVGTYGETNVTGNRTTLTRSMPMVNSSIRQGELKEEWENSTIVAVAKKEIGSIRKGDTVHAYVPASQAVSKTNRPKYYWYDDDRGVYYYDNYDSAPITPDQAYMIIYTKQDGTYGKKIMDAANFAANFDIQKPANQASRPVPVVPVEPSPQEVRPAPEPLQPNSAQPPSTETPSTSQPAPEAAVKQNEEPVSAPVREVKATLPIKKSRVVPLILVSVALVMVLGLSVLLYARSRTKPFVDTSRFVQCERDLRDFEVEIWLRHGKTMEQLVEICLKKFYQDQPAALNIANRIGKGTPKNRVLPVLIKEAAVDSGQAEILYSDFEVHIASIRKIITDVSSRKGLPIKPDAVGARFIAPAGVINHAPAKSEPAARPQPQQNTAPITSAEVEISLPIEPVAEDSGIQPTNYGDVPSYVTNLLDQLAFLSAVERK